MEISQNLSNSTLFNKLLEDAKTLGDAELRAFLRELVKLLPNENKPNYDREQELLSKIEKNNLSSEFWLEYNQLADQERFQELIKITRVRDLERIKLTLELSKIWGTSLDETRSLLNLTSDQAANA